MLLIICCLSRFAFLGWLMKAKTLFQNIMTAVKNAMGISLSSYQLGSICKSLKVSTTPKESEDLINHVNFK